MCLANIILACQFFFFFGWLQIIVEDMSDENLIQSDNDNMMDNLNTEDDEFQ